MHLDVYGDTLTALVTAAALSSTGHQVTLRVPAGQVADDLNAYRMPYQEPGLELMLDQQQKAGRLCTGSAEDMPEDCVEGVFLALSPAAQSFAESLIDQLAARRGHSWLVVNQSNFPVGTTESLQLRLRDGVDPGVDRAVICMPEMLQEGAALQSFMRPSSILVGCDSDWAEIHIREMLRPFNRLRDVMRLLRPREAEFTKLAINGMLATRLGFMNDMASLADALHVDIEQVRMGMGADPRIGEAYLYPGCGFGGMNFSRNVMSLADTLESSGVGSELLEQVLLINERQKEVLFRKLWQHYHTELNGKTVTLWGAAFKPGTGRIDNAPALKLMEALWAQGVTVRVHDPKALPTLLAHYGERADLVLCDDPYEAARGADALMLVTEWKDYWSPDYRRLRTLMAQPLLLDGRNILDPDFVRSSGFVYYGIGRQ
ncbi:UDP-glucose/GDP-mannose dehydrogenase family protein [Alcanivorax sp. 1008]|uniref:UDP-glucose dehydrogenase family protein n=1 Tax=Alcanivorax sp. 1008 TaxID=2816853 RepID=UPI001DF16F54|nr:nucleotide sugar dehydrogenase [Alcanivorax sp. 1008]MCC1496267.1 UDP-glucose/GDP-mannose dehydrogenase family protein [Alcanivorax sp. 1008]